MIDGRRSGRIRPPSRWRRSEGKQRSSRNAFRGGPRPRFRELAKALTAALRGQQAGAGGVALAWLWMLAGAVLGKIHPVCETSRRRSSTLAIAAAMTAGSLNLKARSTHMDACSSC
jgi:hypothetical protein